MKFLFDYNGIGLSKTNNSETTFFYVLGILMLLSGIGKLFFGLNNENADGFFSILLPIITMLVGLGVLIIAKKDKKYPKPVNYFIQIDDERITTRYGNKVYDIFIHEIGSIDFKAHEIHLYDKTKAKMTIDLRLVTPVKKKNELIQLLKKLKN